VLALIAPSRAIEKLNLIKFLENYLLQVLPKGFVEFPGMNKSTTALKRA
jgi:hypothetical protein